MSPNVMFLFFERVGLRQLLNILLTYVGRGGKKNSDFYKVNQYTCKLYELKVLCLMLHVH